MKLSAVVQRENQCYVCFCPELDIASQVDTVEEAGGNLKEALNLLFECAPVKEIQQRLSGEVHVVRIKVAVDSGAC